MTTAKKTAKAVDNVATGTPETTTTATATTTAAPLAIAIDDMVTIKRGNRPMSARVAAVGSDNVNVILKSTKTIENLPITSVLAVIATGKAAEETEGYRKKAKATAKTDRAVEILLRENGIGGRRHVMNIFIQELNMQESTANTYYYLARTKAEQAGHTIPEYVKAVEEAAPVATSEAETAAA